MNVDFEPAGEWGWFLTSTKPPFCPGPSRVGSRWVVPLDVAVMMGLPATGISRPPWPDYRPEGLYAWQQDGWARARHQVRMLIADEMGLGKTVTALTALKDRWQSGDTAVIVCPAVARGVWERHFKVWWPEAPEVAVLRPGQKGIPSAPILVVSFEMASRLESFPTHLIVDESHYVKEPKAARSKAVRALATGGGLRLLLTGTPIGNDPGDAWNQIDLLCPGALGTRWVFRNFYQNKRVNVAGFDEFYGIREDRAEQLKARLAVWSVRTTKASVAHLLPPLRVSAVPVPFKKRDLEEALRDFEANPEGSLAKAASKKLSFTEELVSEILETGGSHVAILCHRKDTAELFGRALGGAVITGDVPEVKRHEILESLAAAPKGILVATMHSISTALSLTAFPDVLYVELDWRLQEVLQSMARFHRITGSKPVHIRCLFAEGSLEEKIAVVLERQIRENSTVLASGLVDAAAGQVMGPALSDEEMFQRLLEKLND